MRISVLREIPDDPLLRNHWDELVQSMESPQVFYTYEWAISVQRAYSEVVKPLLLLGYEGQSLVGLAAFAEEPDGKIVFLAGTTADYCDFLSSPAIRENWCEAVFSELRKLKYSSLNLANLPADSETAFVLQRTAKRHGYRTFQRPAYQCARIVLSSPEQRESLRLKTAGKKMRRNLNLLGKSGQTVFSSVVSEKGLEEDVSLFCKAHVSRFLSTGRLSNLIQLERRTFLRELARQLSVQGWLSLSRFMVGDACVAWNYGFQFAGSWFWYQPTFSSEYEDYSPGLCLLGKIVESACDTPEIGVVDLGLGAEDYKNRFATESRQTLHVSFNSSWLAGAKTVLQYRAAQIIKASPRAERGVRDALHKATRLKSCLRKDGLSGFCRGTIRGLRRSLFGRGNMHLFQWCGSDSAGVQADNFTLQELSTEILSQAAMEYFDDRDTLAYLLRCSGRLRNGLSNGFALLSSQGVPVHFCWVDNANDLLKADVSQRALSANAVLIFDCWTPPRLRDKGYFEMAITETARWFRAAGKNPWISSAARDCTTGKCIARAGFDYKFTLRSGLPRTAERVEHSPVAFSATSASAQ